MYMCKRTFCRKVLHGCKTKWWDWKSRYLKGLNSGINIGFGSWSPLILSQAFSKFPAQYKVDSFYYPYTLILSYSSSYSPFNCSILPMLVSKHLLNFKLYSVFCSHCHALTMIFIIDRVHDSWFNAWPFVLVSLPFLPSLQFYFCCLPSSFAATALHQLSKISGLVPLCLKFI